MVLVLAGRQLRRLFSFHIFSLFCISFVSKYDDDDDAWPLVHLPWHWDWVLLRKIFVSKNEPKKIIQINFTKIFLLIAGDATAMLLLVVVPVSRECLLSEYLPSSSSSIFFILLFSLLYVLLIYFSLLLRLNCLLFRVRNAACQCRVKCIAICCDGIIIIIISGAVVLVAVAVADAVVFCVFFVLYCSWSIVDCFLPRFLFFGVCAFQLIFRLEFSVECEALTPWLNWVHQIKTGKIRNKHKRDRFALWHIVYAHRTYMKLWWTRALAGHCSSLLLLLILGDCYLYLCFPSVRLVVCVCFSSIVIECGHAVRSSERWWRGMSIGQKQMLVNIPFTFAWPRGETFVFTLCALSTIHFSWFEVKLSGEASTAAAVEWPLINSKIEPLGSDVPSAVVASIATAEFSHWPKTENVFRINNGKVVYRFICIHTCGLRRIGGMCIAYFHHPNYMFNERERKKRG